MPLYGTVKMTFKSVADAVEAMPTACGNSTEKTALTDWWKGAGPFIESAFGKDFAAEFEAWLEGVHPPTKGSHSQILDVGIKKNQLEKNIQLAIGIEEASFTKAAAINSLALNARQSEIRKRLGL